MKRPEAGIAAALRLTREGRLTEAVTVIQRTLNGSGSGSAQPATPPPSRAGEPSDLASRVRRALLRSRQDDSGSESPGMGGRTLHLTHS